MKFYLNILSLIFLSFFTVSCSTMNDWDVSKIIDKTERWLFETEDNTKGSQQLACTAGVCELVDIE